MPYATSLTTNYSTGRRQNPVLEPWDKGGGAVIQTLR